MSSSLPVQESYDQGSSFRNLLDLFVSAVTIDILCVLKLIVLCLVSDLHSIPACSPNKVNGGESHEPLA